MLRNNVAFQNQGTMRMMKTNTYIQGNQVHILNMSFSILEPDDGNSLSDLHTGRKLKVIFLGALSRHTS